MAALVEVAFTIFCCSCLHSLVSGKVFSRAPAPSTSCADASATSVTARNELACAFITSQDDAWRSFSFTNGVCVRSKSPVCTFVETVDLLTTSNAPGYQQQIDYRRFWVFQQRKTGAMNFSRNWSEYELGFGDKTEFWSGLLTLNALTRTGNTTLRMEMTTLDGSKFVAEWSGFTVGNASTNYIMSYGSFLSSSSNVSHNALAFHKDMQFSTFDRDNDRHGPPPCSVQYGNSGFWFKDCHQINPNGKYSSTEMSSPGYMTYQYVTSGAVWPTLRELRMMLSI